MNTAALLALIAELYDRLMASEARVRELEEKLVVRSQDADQTSN